MNKITKNNLNNFMNSYHFFHDSYIKDINYNLDKNKIDILIKMKMIFTGIKEYRDDDRFSDYIEEAIIKYVKINGKEYILFTSDEIEPSFYVICDNIEYEEKKESW